MFCARVQFHFSRTRRWIAMTITSTTSLRALDNAASSHSNPAPATPDTRMVHAIFPGDTNHYGTLFGGQAMAWMDQAAFICATRWCRKKVVTARSSAIDFRTPVPVGMIVELVARVTRVGRTSMTVLVEMWIEPMDHAERSLACQGEFVLVAVDSLNRPAAVPPMPMPVAMGEVDG